MILAFVPAIIVKSMNVDMLESQKELLRVLTLNAVILGLLFFVWSKEKIEDETTMLLRVRSMASSFLWAVLYVIISPFIDLLFKEPIEVLTSHQVVISMLFVYLIVYYLGKWSR